MRTPMQWLGLSFLSLSAFIAATVPVDAFAAELFVGGTNAADNNAGTAVAPFASIQKAADVSKAGDTITVRAGTYNVGTGLALTRSGTMAAPIVFRAEPGARPIITTNAKVTYNLVGINGDWTEFRGFEITGSDKVCVSIFRASQIKFIGNVIHNCQDAGLWLGSDVVDETVAHHIRIEGNEIYDTVRLNKPRTNQGGWPASVIAQRATDIQFIGNNVHENWGEGIICAVVLRCEMIGNVVHDNFSVNLYFDNARASLAEGNFAYSKNLEPHFRLGSPANGIQLANEDYGVTTRTLMDITIRNNIVVGGGAGVYYGNYSLGGGMRSVRFLGNTFAGATKELVHIDAAAHAQNVFKDNIFIRGSGSLLQAGLSVAGLSLDHNLWFGGAAGVLASATDVNADPLLVDVAGFTPQSFKISKANSPAIDAGIADALLVNDFFGTARGAKVDLGAHQYVSSISGAGGVGGVAGMGGAAGMGGMAATGGSGGNGGSKGTGGSAGGAGAGGASLTTGGTGGISPTGGAGGSATGGAMNGGDTNPGSGGNSLANDEQNEGCGCRIGGASTRPARALWGLALCLALTVTYRRRRRY
jgi:hypothetical protein